MVHRVTNSWTRLKQLSTAQHNLPTIKCTHFNCKKINELLIKDLENRKHVNYNIVKNNADLIPTFFAFMYDLNFKFSIKYLKEKNYLQIFAEKVNENFESRELKEQMQKIMSWYNNFLENVEL